MLGRPLERCSNPFWIGPGEDSSVQIESVAFVRVAADHLLTVHAFLPRFCAVPDFLRAGIGDSRLVTPSITLYVALVSVLPIPTSSP